MLTLKTLAIFSAFAALIVIAALLRELLVNAGDGYVATPVLTPNELEFYGRLGRALPDYLVLPQVAMSALIKPKAPFGREKITAFNKISQQRVDFVICHRDLSVACVVELDDRTHNSGSSRTKDAERDARLASAGIPTLRFQSRNKPAETAIAQAVQDVVDAAAMVPQGRVEPI
jgi:very-short-patch-repair endonuclease